MAKTKQEDKLNKIDFYPKCVNVLESGAKRAVYENTALFVSIG
jgi:hypothetical protein